MAEKGFLYSMNGLKSKEIALIRKIGSKIIVYPLIFFIRRTENVSKLVVSVSKKIGCAVVRNKIRRRIQNAVRVLKIPGEIVCSPYYDKKKLTKKETLLKFSFDVVYRACQKL
jgi:ribonuclease P protein component